MKQRPADAIILLLDRAGNQGIQGKTVLQKKLYFVGVMANLSFNHRPHFYGPYSRSVETELGLLTALGYIDEEVNLVSGLEGRYYKRHDFSLTAEGRQFAERIKTRESSFASDVIEAVEHLDKQGPASPNTLSIAAKVHHIIAREAHAVTYQEFQDSASKLGWEVDVRDANLAADFLTRLGLARRVDSDAR